MILPRLLLFTDRAQLPRSRSLTQTVAECVGAGLTHVVLRELDQSPGLRAVSIAALRSTGVTVFAAHEPLPGAAGVHLSAHGPIPVRAGVVGRSCHGRGEVAAAASEGCHYATLSPFAPTRSKPGYSPPLAAMEYADHPIPVFALGGISAANAGEALATGAYGVAVMGAVMRAADPAAVVAELLAIIGDR